MLVAVEGNNGAGKTTIIQNLSKMLGEKNVIVSKYNSTSIIKEYQCTLRDTGRLKDAILYEYLQFADIYYRVAILKKYINDKEKIVIMDRYIETLLVRDAVRNIDEKQSKMLSDMLPVPDMTFFIHVSPEDSLYRVMKRGKLNNRLWCIGLRDDLNEESLDVKEYKENLKRMNKIYQSFNSKNRYVIESSQNVEVITNYIYKVIAKEIIL